MDPNLLPFVERVGVPALFLLMLLWGAGRWFQSTSERALGLAEKAGTALFPLVIELVRSSATTAQRSINADEKLNSMGTRLDWHHDEMTKAGASFGERLTALEHNTAAARDAAELAADRAGQLLGAMELEARIPQTRRDHA